MIVSVAWLRQYVEIPVDAATLARDLTLHGVKVERLIATGLIDHAVVVGHVLRAEKHPDADRLSVCEVDLGSGAPIGIVCGAPNVAAGQKVAVAQVGARLPNGVKIRKSKIRGVTSNGMICSQVELGLGSEAGGIMVLAADAPVGKPLADVLGESDAILELEITPNRSDQLGHVGVAREIAAIYRKPLRLPGSQLPDGSGGGPDVAVSIEDASDCFRFVARVVGGVRVAPSPAWLASALEKVGVKPINNVVDVTNYVMMELGQPLHGYDLGALPSAEMGVRRARRGEQLQTLDGRTLVLDREHLVITSSDEAVGVAGVMGGMSSRITENTTDVLIESAAFNPRTVRRSRKSLNVSTDASYRFERGSDREVCRRAADRACALLTEVAGGTAGPVADEFPAPSPARTVSVRRATVKRLLGESVSTDSIAALLDRLELRRTGAERDSVTVTVPSFRADIQEEADLVEEVARLYGYENIGKGWQYRTSVPSTPDPLDRFVDRMANHLVARGFTEILTSSFTDGSELGWHVWTEPDPRNHPIPVVNPLSSNQAVLRTHLLPSVLHAVAYNLAHGRRDLGLFAIGPVFLRAVGASGLPEEPLHMTIARTRPAGASFWRNGQEPIGLFDIKAEVESLLATHRPRAFADLTHDFEPTRGIFRYASRGRAVVEGGIVPAAAARDLGLEQPVWYADVDLTALFEHRADAVRYHAYSEFPASRRDLSLVAPAGVSWGQIEKHVAKVGARLLESLQVFDVFRGASVGADRTAYGVRLSFRSAEATLTDAEVDGIVARIVSKLESELGIELRS